MLFLCDLLEHLFLVIAKLYSIPFLVPFVRSLKGLRSRFVLGHGIFAVDEAGSSLLGATLV
jgi:hypothetical protein